MDSTVIIRASCAITYTQSPRSRVLGITVSTGLSAIAMNTICYEGNMRGRVAAGGIEVTRSNLIPNID